MTPKKQSTVRLSDDGWRKLAALASKFKVSKTAILEFAIRDYYNKQMTEAERRASAQEGSKE